jgi:hypothetical protein
VRYKRMIVVTKDKAEKAELDKKAGKKKAEKPEK